MTPRRGTSVVRTIAIVALLGLPALGCSGPYAGKAEKLHKPPKSAEPDEPPAAAVEIKYADECPVKFQEDPKDAIKQHRRNASASTRLVEQADTLLDDARVAKDDKQRAAQAAEAISKLRKALIDAPYHADATYKLAHAYAITRRRGCALALLKRLTELQKYGDFAADARRKIDEAEGDPVFAPFRKQANEAINR